MASLFEKLVGPLVKTEDELPADYAGGLPARHASEGSADVTDEFAEKPRDDDDGGYKTVVEGTGAGYGELKEYVEDVPHPIEKHPVGEAEVQHLEEKHEAGSGSSSFGSGAGSFGSAAGGTAVEGKHHHDKEGKHHTGPISKLKHKVKEGLSKVRKKKDHRGAGGESHSPTSSDDEGGLHAEKGVHR